MSESFAILRQRRSDELAKLADEHMQHDLQSGDRDKLKAAASSISLWTTVGSAVGVSLGLLAAIRLRSTRKAFFSAIRAQERPTKVIFEDGRTESIPDLTPLLKPTTLGDIATYFFATAGGLFLGGELGLCWWYGERDEEYLRGPGEQEENRNCV
ncbi:Pc20g10110 [Penicillium rubens Wisconsin 54-1255]|uniref:Pc20g10110 protein n=1 Tax=Penicillium rubens (strain ATCC 28089 / DSM 1075 / NRRL 1951 / Wisconsin 54-1255) TaxID=500485 RepID=B6HFL2_PENRW|nr:Pc20g10110 [Penicillium rubens Wisconsin 54-1255]